MRVFRFLALTFLFFLLLVAVSVMIVCFVFIVRLSSVHATGIGFVAGGLVRAAGLLLVLAAISAWLFERYWRRKSALREPENRVPLL